ncbi:MAG: hypothetical protein ACREFE_10910 [Limisphaerales bacterium]
MKTAPKASKTADSQQQANDLLAEAMKHPGVKAVMDVFEASEKYHRHSGEFANYIDWQRSPPSFSSCETTQLA